MKWFGSNAKIWLSLISCLFTFNPISASAEELKDEIKDILEIYDMDLLRDFSMDLAVTMPTHFDPKYGVSQAKVRLVGDSSGHKMELKKIKTENIKYDKTEGGGVFDTQNNFLFSFDKQLSVKITPDECRVLHDCEMNVIDPTNKLVNTKQVPSVLEVYPAGHPDPANLFYRHILALGRGYAQLLDQVTSATLDEFNMATVTARGTLFSNHAGTWVLTIDTNAGYLVKKATFTCDGNSQPTFTVESDRVHDSYVPVYEEGVVKFSDYTVKVYLQKLRQGQITTSSAQTFSEVALTSDTMDQSMQRLQDESLLQKGSSIMDFRDIDSDSMPRIQKRK